MKTQETAPQQPAAEGPESASKSFAAPTFSLDASPADGGGGDKRPRDVNKEPKRSLKYGALARNKKFSGPVASKGADDNHPFAMNDVGQGDMDDCYIMAVLASLAQQRPDDLAALISAKEDGSYDVELAIQDKDDTLVWKTVNVEPKFISNLKGEPIYGALGDEDEIWTLIFEKAFAQVLGSYKELNMGPTKMALAALTGKKAESMSLYGALDSNVLKAIETCLLEKRAITASTCDNFDNVSDAEFERIRSIGIHEKHAYAVIGVNVGGEKVTLRNPWKDEKETVLEISDFLGYFDWITFEPS